MASGTDRKITAEGSFRRSDPVSGPSRDLPNHLCQTPVLDLLIVEEPVDEQLPEEVQAHYGPGGPVQAVRTWLESVLYDGDLRSAWPLTDPALRLVLSQQWVWDHSNDPPVAIRPRDELAEALAAEEPTEPMWDMMAAEFLAAVRDNWSSFSFDTWGALSRPRPIAPAYELVVYSYTGGESITVDTPTPLPSLLILAHSTPEGWRVANFAESLPEPGWPPRS